MWRRRLHSGFSHTKLATLASDALLRETKNSNNKMLPPVKIEPGTYHFKFDALLSELTLQFCKSETVRSKYSNVLGESSKS